MSTLTLRDTRWQDIETLAALEAELFGAHAWSRQSWWGSSRPARAGRT